MKLIRIQAWASSKFDPPPSIFTLRRWARDGKVFPQPKKVGRDWLVTPEARYVERDDPVLGSVIYGPTFKKPRESSAAR